VHASSSTRPVSPQTQEVIDVLLAEVQSFQKARNFLRT
jgi:hypothetical protein